MSKDNLILFPKKSNPGISMTQDEAKWMLSGSLLLILIVAVGINSALFSSQPGLQSVAGESQFGSRSIASINPIFKVSWEKRAFKVLDKVSERELANVGQDPSPFDDFAFGQLGGRYSIRKIDGKIMEIRLAETSDQQPKHLLKPIDFLRQHIHLFSKNANQVKAIHVHANGARVIERYELQDKKGQGLAIVQVFLDNNQGLLSMTVQ